MLVKDVMAVIVGWVVDSLTALAPSDRAHTVRRMLFNVSASQIIFSWFIIGEQILALAVSIIVLSITSANNTLCVLYIHSLV